MCYKNLYNIFTGYHLLYTEYNILSTILFIEICRIIYHSYNRPNCEVETKFQSTHIQLYLHVYYIHCIVGLLTCITFCSGILYENLSGMYYLPF